VIALRYAWGMNRIFVPLLLLVLLSWSGKSIAA
jgi:hypothetical protein